MTFILYSTALNLFLLSLLSFLPVHGMDQTNNLCAQAACAATKALAPSLSTEKNSVGDVIIPVGLANQGNSCFMGSSLQALMMLRDLNKYIISQNDLYQFGSIGHAYQQFLSQLHEAQLQKSSFIHYEVLALQAWTLMGAEIQTTQDANEFLSPLLDQLRDVSIIPEVKAHVPEIGQLISTRLLATITNANENFAIDEMEEAPMLNLPIHENNCSLYECLGNFFEKENIDDYKSDSGKTMPIQRQYRCLDIPKYLILGLKRQDYNKVNNTLFKRLNLITFPLEGLDMSSYMVSIESKLQALYSLRAIIVHEGDAQGGHYTAFVKHGSQWYFCDDSMVKAVTVNQIESMAQQGHGLKDTVLPTTFIYER